MQKPVTVVALLAVAICPASIGHVAAGEPPVLALRLEVIGPAPLPFQPARLRLIVENTGNQTAGPLPTPEGFAWFAWKAVGQQVFRNGQMSIRVKLEDTFEGDGRSRLQLLHDRVPLILAPGESTSTSFVQGVAGLEPREDNPKR